MGYRAVDYVDEMFNNNRVQPVPGVTTAGSGAHGLFWFGATPPSGGRTCDQSLDSTLFPVSTTQTWRIGRLKAAYGGTPINLFFHDRLVDRSGLAGNVTTSQAISLPALPRYADGFMVEPWLEVWTAIASSVATDVTMTYTNQAGVAGQVGVTSLASGWATPAKRAHPLVLADGDYGVRSVQSLQLSASSPTAGDLGLALSRRLAFFPSPLTGAQAIDPKNELNAFVGGLPKVLPNACLFMYGLGSTTSVGNTQLEVAFVKVQNP